MNAGELKKLLKDVPNHFEIMLLENPDNRIQQCGYAYTYAGAQEEKITSFTMERHKRSNALVLTALNKE